MTMPMLNRCDTSLAAALADELTIASQLLADLAFDLGSDEATLRKHMTSLQKIDLITQIQLAVADMLRNWEDEDAPAKVSLEAMSLRLHAALGRTSL